MANKEAVKVPTIDLCSVDVEWEWRKGEVFKALQEYGCFEAIYDKVPNEIQKGMFDTLAQVLPLKNKMKEYLEKPYGEYEGHIAHDPFYDDILHKADIILPESVEIFANTLWPDGNPHFCTVMKSYYKPLVELDAMVKRMVLESVGMKDRMDEFMDVSGVFKVRLTKYYKAAEGAAEVELPPHTDPNFLTIIHQKQPGLQILAPNGDWIQPTLSPHSYLVLAADSFMAWTNGRIRSTTHRVIMGADDDRFSIQLFSIQKPGYLVEAPKELVDEEHPLLFKPFDIVKYYEYLFKFGAKNGFGIKAYEGFYAVLGL